MRERLSPEIVELGPREGPVTSECPCSPQDTWILGVKEVLIIKRSFAITDYVAFGKCPDTNVSYF
jgi:hypothetical protein